MINDRFRNAAYKGAISKAVSQFLNNRSRDCDLNCVASNCRVLDVGTGSGLLALLAAKEGAEQVTAIEVEEIVANCATKNAIKNEMEDVVTVITGHSQTIPKGTVPADDLIIPICNSLCCTSLYIWYRVSVQT